MLRYSWQIVLNSLFILLFLNSCGDTTVIQQCESNTSQTDENKSILFKVTGLNIRKIGTADKQYDIQIQESLIKTQEDEDAFYDLLDSLESISQTDGQLEKSDAPVSLQTGKFYNFELQFDSNITFPEGLSFEFELLSEKLDGTYSKVIDYGRTGDLNTTGENALSIDTLIPTDVPDGKYVLILNVVDNRLIVDEATLNMSNIQDRPQLGSIYIEITHDSDSQRVEFVDTTDESDGYLDLSKSMTLRNGYTLDPIGDTTLINYNSSHLEQNITLSATLELENGNVFNLGLLDINDSNIHEEVSYTIPVLNPNEIEVGDISVNYYVKEEDYPILLDLVPDLSEDNTTDGVKAKVKWYVTSNNQDLVVNDIDNEVLITKKDDNFVYNPADLQEAKSLAQYKSNAGETTQYNKNGYEQVSQYKITYDSNNGNRVVEDWTNNNSKYCFKSIDAAVESHDGKYIYLFSGNKATYYTIATGQCGGIYNIDGYFNGPGRVVGQHHYSTLKKVSAAFKTKKGIYLIGQRSDNKYYVEVYDLFLQPAGIAVNDFPLHSTEYTDKFNELIDLSTIKGAVSYDGETVWIALKNNTFTSITLSNEV
jgi:hypothetical protein